MKRTTRYLVPAMLAVSSSIALAQSVPETVDEAAAATVVTTTGTFTGVPSPTDARTKMFLGIRYAAPPVGTLRWAPPQAPTPPAGTVVASTRGHGCPQKVSRGASMLSEDCLFLNVYVPASAKPHSKLPVYYFIHGGMFTVGEGIWYDPSVLVAEHDIIVVTINYRLGALGWLAEPGLVATAANRFQNVGDSGDYGLMDQEFGLQWVQANIESFGGDPRKVTVGGHSAGGISVTNLLTSIDTAAGLFRAAIIESGWFLDESGLPQAAYAKSAGARFEAALGCTPPTDAACLRSQSVENILNAQNHVRIGIVLGTRMVPQDLSTALSTGQFIKVPILHGSTANEGRFQEQTLFPSFANPAIVAAAGGPANYALSHPNPLCGKPAACTYLQEIKIGAASQGIPAPINTVTFDTLIAAKYPLANFPDPYLANDAPSADEALSQMYTDLVVSCGTFDFSSQLAPWVPVFSYEFNDPAAPPFNGSLIKPPNDSYGFPTASEHGADIRFLFTNWSSGLPLDAGEQQLAEQMKAYWANFVTSGDPNIGRNDRDPDFGRDERFYTRWRPFNTRQAVQDLVPGPAVPHPFYTFTTEHFCGIWEPFLNPMNRIDPRAGREGT
jgi:para-nitrobenzyl esterase